MYATTSSTIHTTLPRAEDCGLVARRLVAQALRDLLDDPALDEAEIVTGELADNAYLHGEGSIELRVSVELEHVRVEVVNQGHAAAGIREQHELGTYGLGLTVVDELASAWGASDGSTRVWAELER